MRIPGAVLKSGLASGLTAAALFLIALTGGAVGAFGFWWAQGKNTEQVAALAGLASTAAAVLGWYQSTRLNADAQRELLHLQLLNEARQILVHAFRAEQDQLDTCSNQLILLKFSDPVTPILRTESHELLQRAPHNRASTEWVFALEEHWSLFPELQHPQRQLALRQLKLHAEYRRFAELLIGPGNLPREFDAAVEELIDHVSDQSALFLDLRFYVQGRALGAVSGHAAPQRHPANDRVPRLSQCGDHSLAITVPNEARKAELEALGWL